MYYATIYNTFLAHWLCSEHSVLSPAQVSWNRSVSKQPMFHHPWRLYALHNWSVNVIWQLTIACQCGICCDIYGDIYLCKITQNHTAIKKINGRVARHKRLSYRRKCHHKNENQVQFVSYVPDFFLTNSTEMGYMCKAKWVISVYAVCVFQQTPFQAWLQDCGDRYIHLYLAQRNYIYGK